MPIVQSATFTTLPNELLLDIFSYLSESSLNQVRLINKRCTPLSSSILIQRYTCILNSIDVDLDRAEKDYTLLQASSDPQLSHYRQFVTNLSTNDIKECIWYATPSKELSTVCECLVRLNGAESDGPMLWPQIRKHLSRFDFKQWYINLKDQVDSIRYVDMKKVERIIMLDHDITYERLRGVSMAGYRLLIAIAACIQYCTISHTLKKTKRAVQELSRQKKAACMFLLLIKN